MRLLYSIGIYGYQTLIWLLSAFSPKAKLWIKGRRNWKEKLAVLGNEKVIWMHAASLGEFEQGKPVLEILKKEHPSHKILLTFFSPSGYEVRKNYEQADLVMYLPSDTFSNAKYFIENLDVKLALFVKYEFWFNFLHVLKINHISTVFFSVIFREDQLFFKSYGGWFAKHLLFVKHFFVQNEESKRLLNTIGCKEVSIAGDTRFDAVQNTFSENLKFDSIESFCVGHKVIVCGSTWARDHELLVSFINTSDSQVKFIIAPHEIKEQEVVKLVSNLSSVGRYSRNDFEHKKVLIVDQIGILKHLYKYGDVSYIGGGFGAGIHNTLEAVIAKIPVVFGPKYQKFQEAIDLIELGVGFSIRNETELVERLKHLLAEERQMEVIAKNADLYVKRSIGASGEICAAVQQML